MSPENNTRELVPTSATLYKDQVDRINKMDSMTSPFLRAVLDITFEVMDERPALEDVIRNALMKAAEVPKIRKRKPKSKKSTKKTSKKKDDEVPEIEEKEDN